jgi:potassium efflux system protein
MDRVHSEFTFLIRWWLPVVIVAALTIRLTRATGDELIGRTILLIALLMISFHIGRHQFRELQSSGRTWFREPLNRFRFALSCIFLVVIFAIVYGQVFSVTVIIWSLLQTLWVFVGLIVLHSILMRWSRVARRHLRLNELLAQRAEAASGEEKTDAEEELADLGDISAETQQLILSGTFVTGAIALIYIWAPLLPVLEGFDRITLWTTTSQLDGETVTSAVTLTKLIITVAVITFTIFAAKRIPALVEMVLRSRTSVSSGARYTTSTLLNYSIIGIGLIIGLSSLGLQWDKLQWLVAALGVGIGFGLQEIVANFISGLIILFERPIRVGDIITIGDKDGKVLKIRIRATTIRDWDGKELLVPNKEFITGRLLNWTLSDSHTRLVIPVGIAYGSNVEQALRILTEVVNSNSNVMSDPPATFFFLGFGDNSLNLEARCFLANVDDRLPTLSSLHTAINNAFNDAGIVIAFPQRDLHFDADRPLRIALDHAPEQQHDKS